MGICASCLGLDRQEARESEGLLYEDATQPQYGTVTPGATLPEPDPEELRREREVLERICAQTSNGASSPTTTIVDENAWLAATQGAERELWDEVKGLNPGELVLELNPPTNTTR
ncbi:unnamed protein product [Aureobasidium pullulans]|nr:unnamed protein product [Aureobasidium pullulans]CAD0047142.1 unnamed protein product [Aureobasidium pullulans]